MPSSSPAALRVDAVLIRLGQRTVLDGLTLQAGRGALTAVLGPNGAGKTTLLRCCTGLLRPAAGTITVLSEPPGSASWRRGWAGCRRAPGPGQASGPESY